MTDKLMYDVQKFIQPVPKQYERTPDYMDAEISNQYFRYERNNSFVAELIRERFNEQKVRGI